MERVFTVNVQRSGRLLQEIDYPSQVACSDVEPQLQLQSGAGTFSPAGNKRLCLLPSDQLELGRTYIYNVVPPRAGGGAGGAEQEPPSLAELFYDVGLVWYEVFRSVNSSGVFKKRGWTGNKLYLQDAAGRDQHDGYQPLLHPHAD